MRFKRGLVVFCLALVFMAGCKTTQDVVIPNTMVSDNCTGSAEVWWGQKGEVPAEVWKCHDWIIRSQAVDNQ